MEPDTAAVARRTGGRLPRAGLRAAVALALAGCAVLAWLHQSGYRGWEAWSAGGLVGRLTGERAAISRPLHAFFPGIGTPHVFGLTVTSECTSLIVTIAACIATAVLASVTRIPLLRLVLAAAAAIAAFYVLNVLRLVGIALAVRQWGMSSGYHWSHVWAGTFVTVLGGIGVCALYLVLLGVRRTAR